MERPWYLNVAKAASVAASAITILGIVFMKGFLPGIIIWLFSIAYCICGQIVLRKVKSDEKYIDKRESIEFAFTPTRIGFLVFSTLAILSAVTWVIFFVVKVLKGN
jgi:hypothetical protein